MTELATSDEDLRIHITYDVNGSSNKLYFDKDYAEQLLQDINSNPKYNQ